MTDATLHAALLVAPVGGHRARLESVVPSEGQQRRVEADGVAAPLGHDGLQVVVEHHARHAVQGAEGRLVTRQEAAQALVVEEAHVGHARPRQHHHEGRQVPGRAAHGDLAAVGPVDLGVLAGQRGQALVGLRRRAGAQPSHHPPEVRLRARVPALGHHREQSACGQGRVLLQGLVDEGQVGVHDGGPHRQPRRDALALQDPADRGVVHAHLVGDGADPPLLHEVQPQDALLELGGDHEALRMQSAGRRWSVPSVRRAPAERLSAKPPGSAAAGNAAGVGMGIGTPGPWARQGDGVAVGLIRVLRPGHRRGDRGLPLPDLQPRGGGSLMRHLRCLTLQVSLLPGGVVGAASRCLLVAATGPPQALPSTDIAAVTVAVAVAAVAAAAEHDLLPTARAAEQPVGLSERLPVSGLDRPAETGDHPGRVVVFRTSAMAREARWCNTGPPGSSGFWRQSPQARSREVGIHGRPSVRAGCNIP